MLLFSERKKKCLKIKSFEFLQVTRSLCYKIGQIKSEIGDR